jgi:hypothetical protein
MTKWEYRITSVQPEPMTDSLNAMGAEGWEAVCVLPSGQHVLFKRPLQESKNEGRQ